jgi:hypothetical protein
MPTEAIAKRKLALTSQHPQECAPPAWPGRRRRITKSIRFSELTDLDGE